MLKVTNVEVIGFAAAIRGMRNPMNSWTKSDSIDGGYIFAVGDDDLRLMKQLAAGGAVHAKYRRFINVTIDILAPLYWWKEFDTYKVGTVANSCSTMHKIHAKEFELDDFSHEHLDIRCREVLEELIKILNDYRQLYVDYNPDDFEINGCPPKKMFWWQMIQLLPTSYNQLRTVHLNYEVAAHIIHDRENHKLDEWHILCDKLKGLPYADGIIFNIGKDS